MKIDYTNVMKAFDDINLEELKEESLKARDTLLNKTGLGSEMTGWVDYPTTITKDFLDSIKKIAKEIQSKCSVLVIVAIGGSYLGTKAIIEMLKPYFKIKNDLKVIYAGNTLSSTYMYDLLSHLDNTNFCINYVSKSGFTTEPAIAFRMLKQLLIKQHGDQYKDYIYVTTDGSSGCALKQAQDHGYQLLTIPSDIGGRYSCFTPVTLLPMACLDLNIQRFINGAIDARNDCIKNDYEENVALQYASFRNLNYRKGKKVEILSVFSPRFASISEWWQQLFGESEGKDGKGLFPTSLIFSTALHSVGQFIQEGSKILFETILSVKNSRYDIMFPIDNTNEDELNYISEYTLQEVNRKMLEATVLAHSKGGTPNIVLEIDRIDTYNLGYLMYTLLFSCAVSSYLLGVNPFNQPGVQEYKDNMYALLGKVGYEDLRKELEHNLSNK